jgi:benzoate-CoA ligase family protein
LRDNTVFIDRSEDPPAIRTSPVFNVAVPFIDRHQEEGRGEKTVIRTADGEVTFAELADRVNRWGNALKTLGVKSSERMLMVVKDCPEFFHLFFGAIKAGVIPVPVNTMLRAHDYTFLIEDSGCKILVYGPEFAETVEGALADAGHKPSVTLKVAGPNSASDLLEQASPELAPAPTSAEDDCFWLYSSGSTGNPKGVVHAHKAMLYTGQCAAVDTLEITEDDVCFSASKLFHSYGFGNALTFPLWIGCTAFLSDRRVSPEMTFEIIERFRPTVFFGVPTLYAQQCEYLESAQPDISSLRVCVSAGEALPGDIFKRWKEKTGTLILEIYGSTEILHAVIGNTEADHNPGSSGRVVRRYEAKIVNEDGKPAETGEISAVHVRGGSAAKYYWNDPEKTAATMLPGGWLNMGDNSYQDEDGWFFYSGRRDDMMKVGGLWCSPFEIEARLIEHPKVLEAAVVGRADPDNLIKPEAFIVLNNPVDADKAMEDELLAHCQEGLAHYKYPRWFNFVDDLPKTATGKIQRYKLRE